MTDPTRKTDVRRQPEKQDFRRQPEERNGRRQPEKQDFRRLPDLASRTLGGTVMFSDDDFYADAHRIIAPGPARHDPDLFGDRGKVYDGWETRRRRDGGTGDSVIIRLGVPGVVRGVDIDTSHFKGNYPPHATVEATTVLGYPTLAQVQAAEWVSLVDRTDLDGDSANVVEVDATEGPDRLATHIRLTIHPDGGVARLRAFGEAVPDPRHLGGRVDLGALTSGGLVEACSNMFYSSPANVLSPGRARVMSDGWETSRRRDDGNDWLVVRLGAPGVLHEVVIDTSRFVGNAPGWATLTDVDTGTELLTRTALLPDTEHRFRLATAPAAHLVRLDIHPDGGISRLRLVGAVPADAQDALARRWLDLLPPDQASAVEPTEFFL